MVTTIIRTHNMDFVKAVYCHPKIYKKMSDDFSLSPDKFVIEDDKRKYFLLPINDEQEVLGLIGFHPLNLVLYQIHIAILPQFWGKNIPDVLKTSLDWMKENTTCKTVLSATPKPYRLAIRLAKAIGATKVGELHQAIQINGILHDQELYEYNLWAQN